MNAVMVTMSDIQLLGVMVIVASVSILVGAAIGYANRVKDVTAELAKAWSLGHQAALKDQAEANRLNRPIRPSDNPFKLRRPFLRRTKADVPHI